MGKEVHIIEGGVGMGSTVKMVHQLLAGVHIVVAAEALALAAAVLFAAGVLAPFPPAPLPSAFHLFNPFF